MEKDQWGEFKQFSRPGTNGARKIHNIQAAQNDAQYSHVLYNQETSESTGTDIRYPQPRSWPTTMEPTRWELRTYRSGMPYRNSGGNTGERKQRLEQNTKKGQCAKKYRADTASKRNEQVKGQWENKGQEKTQGRKERDTMARTSETQEKRTIQERSIVNVAQKKPLKKPIKGAKYHSNQGPNRIHLIKNKLKT